MFKKNSIEKKHLVDLQEEEEKKLKEQFAKQLQNPNEMFANLSAKEKQEMLFNFMQSPGGSSQKNPQIQEFLSPGTEPVSLTILNLLIRFTFLS